MNTNPPSRSTAAQGNAVGGGDSLTRALGAIALIGVAIITIVCLAVQFLRTDLDWVTVQMSLYVNGPYGGLVRASFFAPAPALIALGVGWYLALRKQARCIVSLALFVTAAIALCFVGGFAADATAQAVTVHGAIHEWAAFATFVCATSAMALQSWWLRLDPNWRGHFPSAFGVAAIAIVYFWVYALFKPIPRGLGEKGVIALVLLWMWRAAWWLVRSRATRFSHAPHMSP
ncbi:MAG: DUF998 domain-containing protein [Rhodanobacteraceae bacterium]